jgi:2-dehydro-3-deoxyphosphogluconate aldolase/(4S)-4-hydroxy-2-oxoglutarate aldolase
MKFTKQQVVAEFGRCQVIPVFYHQEIEIAKAIVEACYNGGIKVIEFTNRGENAFAVFVELVELAKKLPGLIIGIGTIMDRGTAEKFIQAGTNFIVSPIMDVELAEVCNKHKVLWVPGCATLTEIVSARAAGADLIKLFPAFVLGPKFVSAVLQVIPDLKLMPTGGIEPTKESLTEWFKAGIFCAGLGSQLISKEIIESANWSQLETRVRYVSQMLQQSGFQGK